MPTHVFIASLAINNPFQSGTFVTTNEPSLTHHYPQSMVYIRDQSWHLVHSMGWDKCVMTTAHHCVFLHSSFTALKLFYDLTLLHPSLVTSI
jgi:hypothetical protein